MSHRYESPNMGSEINDNMKLTFCNVVSLWYFAFEARLYLERWKVINLKFVGVRSRSYDSYGRQNGVIFEWNYLGTSTHSTKVEKSTDFDLLGLGSFDLSTSSSSNKSTSGSDTHSSSSKLLISEIQIDFSFWDVDSYQN